MEYESTISDVAFFYDQAIHPIAVFLLTFETFDELEQTVFEFEGKVVQFFEILL